MTTLNTQVGLADESTYGTPVTVSRFLEYNSESVRLNTGRVESKGMRTGTRVLRSDRFEPYRIGASGRLNVDVPTKGFGLVLKHMFGTAAIGTITDSNYTQTFTIGSLLGDFFTMQFNRPFHPSGTNQAFTYHGGKVTDWTLSCDMDGLLTADLGLDFEDEDTSTALATASYASDWRCFSWAGGAITIGGSSVEIRNFSVSMDNMLDVDRRYQRASALKKEPTEDDMRVIEWSCTADFTDLTQYNRVRDNSRANNLAAIVATYDGPVVHAGATLPRLELTMTAARFDEASFNISGPAGLRQTLSGIATFDGTNSALQATYRTTDAAA